MPTNKGARSRGNKAEALLQHQLADAGYEVRRTHLSAFPDIIAWNDSQFLMIEVKARAIRKDGTDKTKVVNAALSLFRNAAKQLKVVHNGATLLCYVRIDDAWIAYEWTESGTRETVPVVKGET